MAKVINVSELAKELEHDIDEAIMAIKVSCFNEVVRNTVVDTGRLRGNWQIGTGSAPTGIRAIDGTGDAKGYPDTNGEQYREIVKEVESNEAAALTWLVNNLPYAAVLDNRDGMVEKGISHAVNNAQRILDNAGN